MSALAVRRDTSDLPPFQVVDIRGEGLTKTGE